MRNLTLLAATIIGCAIFSGSVVLAAGDLSKQDAITVRVDLGKDGIDKHRFYPDKLTFEAGKYYIFCKITGLDIGQTVTSRRFNILQGEKTDLTVPLACMGISL
ncbi:hypothetical protein LCGC14_2925300, partial [marine sediment metagenome]